GIEDLTGRQLSFFSSFTTAAGADTTPPVVTQVSPPNGAVNVPVNAPVVMRVSEPVNASTVSNSSIQVSTGGQLLAGAVSVSSDRLTLTWAPVSGQPPATTTLPAGATLTVNASGFTDRAGNLVTPFSSTFATSGSTTADTTRPSLLTSSPVNGATGVANNSSIILNFNEAINPGSVNALDVFLSRSIRIAASVPNTGTFDIPATASASGSTVTLTPTSQLPGNAADS